MVTALQLNEYLNQVMAEHRLAGNQVELRHAELAARALNSAGGVDEALAALERDIEAQARAGDQAALHDLQSAAGTLMKAAEYYRDKETARRLRLLAARSANAQEDLGER